MADKYWRHKPSGGLYGFNPHVDFDKDPDYEELTGDEVNELLGKPASKKKAKKKVAKKKTKATPKPFPVAKKKWDDDKTGELDDLDDILG